MRLLNFTKFIVLFSASLLLACPQPVPTPEDEACEHLAEGPASAVTAVATGEGPFIADDHRRYDVSLVPVAGGNGGRVRFAADEAGDFLFFTSAEVTLAFTDAAGSPVEIEETVTGSTVCTEIGAQTVIPLAVGTYHLELGPTAETTVSLVVEHGGEHEGHAE